MIWLSDDNFKRRHCVRLILIICFVYYFIFLFFTILFIFLFSFCFIALLCLCCELVDCLSLKIQDNKIIHLNKVYMHIANNCATMIHFVWCDMIQLMVMISLCIQLLCSLFFIALLLCH